MELDKKRYMEQGMDLKRLILVLGKKLWLVVAAAVLGAVLGGLTYKIVTNITNGEPEYRASADYYITFFREGADYFNAFTWDGILRDDPIVDYALTLLPEEITKDMVKAAVSGEMLGDYRILTVHVNASTPELANKIAKAYQDSLWNFGQEMELLDEVKLWSQEEAVVFEKNNKTANAAFLGALIATLMVVFGLFFYYVLEDAVYVEKDAVNRFGLPVYGFLTKGNDELQKQMYDANMKYVFGINSSGDKNNVADGGNPANQYEISGIKIWNGEIIPTADDFISLREAKRILINIPWGRNNGRQVERVLSQLQLQGCNVKGIVITEADDVFVKAYYAIERRRENKL